MLILAVLSGIQEFLFDVRESGGGQAKSLRHRSFRIQLIAECVAERLMDATRDYQPHLLFCAAAKIAIHVEHARDMQNHLRVTAADIENLLLNQVHGRLYLSLAIAPSDDRFADLYERANRSLTLAKLRAFALETEVGIAAWREDGLIAHEVYDADTEARIDADIGSQLVKARWLVIERQGGSRPSNTIDTVGLQVRLCNDAPAPSDALLSYSNLERPEERPSGIDEPAFRVRRLARHVPRDAKGDLIEFVDLARHHSRGAAMLGVLKADVDSLGQAISETLKASGSDGAVVLKTLSEALDLFFAKTLETEKQQSPWDLIYTVFSGGDDMLIVGPWDIVLDFAGHVHRLFEQAFGPTAAGRPCPSPLTISAGVAVIRPKYPIHIAAQQADDLLDTAKHRPAPGAAVSRDQCAALGEVWKWADHDHVIADGKRLADWVDEGIIQRGWLHTLLALALLRRGKAGPEYAGVAPERATSRLAYHVARNWPQRQDHPRDDKQRAGNVAREWIESVLKDFDANPGEARSRVKHLLAVIRYAILATRADSTEEIG